MKTGTEYLQGFNDQLAVLMSKIIGFEESLKTVISLDTIIICVLSLILIKVLKDEFIAEGY